MSAEKTTHDANALLVFSVGPVLCCAPTMTVEAVIMPPLIHKVPGSDHNHPGVFRHTHGMVSVVDLRQRFGVEEAAWQQPGRVIVAEIAGGHGGFLVDTIQDVMLWPEQGWGAVPALVPRDVFKRTLLLKKQIHLYADFDDLFRIRESGYLREHIAMLEKQQRETEIEPVAKTLIETAATEIRYANIIDSVPVVTIDNATTIINPAPARPVVETNKPEKAVAYMSGKKPEQKTGPEIITTSKLTAAKTPKHHITDNKKPVVVASHPIGQAEEAVFNSFNVQADNINLLRTEPPESASGKVYIFGIIILLLAAVVLLVTSFSDSEKAMTVPELAAVSEQVHTDGDLDNQLNLNNDYQADVSRDAEGIVITIDEVAEETKFPAAVPLYSGEPNSTEVLQSAVIPAPAPAPVIENKNIIHIVVPGDTLWDIANRYVRDPWRYPELAKLSNIKNPHRIYPGNKVKIIIRQSNKTAP